MKLLCFGYVRKKLDNISKALNFYCFSKREASLCSQLINFLLLIHIWWILVSYKHLRIRYSYGIFSSLSSLQFQAFIKEFALVGMVYYTQWFFSDKRPLWWELQIRIKTYRENPWEAMYKDRHSWCLELMIIASRTQWWIKHRKRYPKMSLWRHERCMQDATDIICSSCWIMLVFVPVWVSAVMTESL